MTHAPQNLDRLDRDIILELQQNARRSFKSIAAKLQVSESTISNRVNRLTGSGVLKLQARVDPFCLPHQVAALIGMNLERRCHQTAIAQIENLPGVNAVWRTTGKYDLFVEVMVDSIEMLNEFLFSAGLDRIEGLTFTETYLVLNSRTKFFKVSDSTAD